MMPQCAGAPVAGEGGVVPSAEAGFVDVNRASAAAAAVVGEGLDGLIVEVFVEARVAVVVEAGEVVEAHVPAAAVVRVVAGEHVHQRADGDLEDVARAGGVDFEAGAIGPHADDAAAAMLDRPTIGAGGLQETEVAARDVKPAVDAEAEAVRGVIGGAIFEAVGDVIDEDVLFLSDAVVIGIDELAEVRRMHKVESVVVPHEAARAVHLAEDLRFIGTAIAIEIAQADDAATVGFALHGAVSVGGNVKRAIRLGGEEDGVVRGSAVGKEGDIESFSDLHVGQDGGFLLRREFDDLRRHVAAVFVGIGGLVVFLLLVSAQLRRDGLDAWAFEPHLADAGPAAALFAEGMNLHKTDAVRLGEVIRVRRVLFVRAAIDQRGPRLTIGAAFDFEVIHAVVFPGGLDAGERLRLLQLQLQPLRIFPATGAPAGAFVIVHGTPGEVVLALLLAARGRLDARGVFRHWRWLRSLDRLSGHKRHLVLPLERREELRRELVTGPKQATCDQIEITSIGDGFRVMPDGRAETAGTGLFVRPGDDGIHGLAFDHLAAHRERMRVEEVHVVIELLFDRGPIGERLRDRVLFIHKRDRDGLLRAVGARLQAEALEPAILARAEAVHGAVKLDAGDGFVSVEDAGERLLVVHAGRALVVDDDVVALCPIHLVIDWQRRVRGLVVGPNDIHLHIRAALDALGDDEVLLRIVMAAATGDEEGFEGLGGGERRADYKEKEEGA